MSESAETAGTGSGSGPPAPAPEAPARDVPTAGALRARLEGVTLRDARRLDRAISAARKVRPAPKRHARLRRLDDEVAAAERRLAERTARIPATVVVPDELPIAERADELVKAISENQVVVVAGETGSGKSTQLPKLCLRAGRGVRGMIGHTQPRRLAASSIAARVAEELGGDVGDLVGYQVRFTDAVSERTAIKVMPDGILLNELQRDRDLSAYDTIIVDEAHERGLNIDFILGYLAQLLPRRPDLTVIVTSATIDTERFAAHFATPDGTPAPIYEVSGRTYPVEVRYRPLVETTEEGDVVERDLTDAIVDAVTELAAEGPGDVLVFASGERDIRDAADALRDAAKRSRALSGIEVLPLYSRLSAAEQQQVFAPHRGRRVVIATNIAETSLTVPGIRYVVDPGLARISRYNRRTKVQRLPIEPISQASADQRMGRCGRVGPGIAIRLFDADDYDARPPFTDPEILRTNLASVVLQMTALGLGDVAAFPFVEAPDSRLVADGVALLEELGALAAGGSGALALSDIGRKLARIPLDPRLARMLLAAADEGCVHEVMVIASFLSIQDPRERPRDVAHTAEQHHARFHVPGSDPLGVIALWDHLRRMRRQLSGNQFRKRCRAEFLHFLRIREWQDVHGQLRRVLADLDIPTSRALAPGEIPAGDAADAVHRAMLAGLLGMIGMRDGDSREYLGTRGTRFRIGRRSSLADRPPPWVVAAELVETTGMWAGMAAAIRPQWVEALAGDLVQRTHGEPRWDRARGAAVTTERVTFRGLPIVAGRTVALSRVDPAAARRMLIDQGLVEGDVDERFDFATRNAAILDDVRAFEDRVRRVLLADEDVLRDLYDARIPDDVTSVAHLRSWWRRAAADDPDLLVLDRDEVLAELDAPDPAAFPDTWTVGGAALDVSYTFDPAVPEADGLTVDVPIERLPQLHPGTFDWLVPGMRAELVTALVRALPKALRRGLVPVPDTVAAVLDRIDPSQGPLLTVLARELTRVGGQPVTPEAWRGARIPDHLRVRYRIVDGPRVLATGSDLGALKEGVAAHVRQAVARSAPTPQATGLTAWTIGDLPRTVTASGGGVEMTSYPALVDEGSTAGVRSFPTAAEQRRAMRLGTRRLLRLSLPNPVRTVDRALDRPVKLALTQAPHADVAVVVEDCTACVIDAVVDDHGGPAWTAEGFEAIREDLRDRADRLIPLTARVVADVVTRAAAVKDRLRQPAPPALEAGRHDVARQLGRLVYPGFVAATGGARLRHLPRYLQGMEVRLDAMGRNPQRDADAMAVVADLEEEQRLLVDLRPGAADALADLRWQLEELRISLFAQQLGTAQKVSEARIRAALAAIRVGHL
ncbi:ATP-dependent RNA helicase HrpA [Euzebya sp.]|uniref:ATP-dependent RNA helicase HrpA n=1 Tax=Euzebya sp. TaxID=1971409 RepID=UPI003515E4F8